MHVILMDMEQKGQEDRWPTENDSLCSNWISTVLQGFKSITFMTMNMKTKVPIIKVRCFERVLATVPTTRLYELFCVWTLFTSNFVWSMKFISFNLMKLQNKMCHSALIFSDRHYGAYLFPLSPSIKEEVSSTVTVTTLKVIPNALIKIKLNPLLFLYIKVNSVITWITTTCMKFIGCHQINRLLAHFHMVSDSIIPYHKWNKLAKVGELLS